MEQYDELGFREAFLDAVARRVGIGDTLADGLFHSAEKWGRLEEDKESGVLRSPAWGTVYHFADTMAGKGRLGIGRSPICLGIGFRAGAIIEIAPALRCSLFLL